MSAGTFERQAELLEQIHALARELSELAGDTIAITIQSADKYQEQQDRLAEADQLRARVAELEHLTSNGSSPGTATDQGGARAGTPAAQPAPPGEGSTKGKSANADAVLEALRAEGDWVTVAALLERTGIKKNTMAGVLARLRHDGAAEHNGKIARASRWRVASEGTAAPATPTDVATPPAIEGLSPEEQPQPSPDPLPGGASSNGQPADNRADRVVESLRFEAATLTELCLHTDIPRRDLRTIVADLERAGRVVKCGLRFPQRHAVYGVAE